MHRMDELIEEVVDSFDAKDRVWGLFINGQRVKTNSGSFAWKRRQDALLALYQHIKSLIHTWYDRETNQGYLRIGDVKIQGYHKVAKPVAKELLERGIAKIKKLPE